MMPGALPEFEAAEAGVAQKLGQEVRARQEAAVSGQQPELLEGAVG